MPTLLAQQGRYAETSALYHEQAAMKDFLRLLRLFDGSWRWVLAGIGLTVLVILANVGLLALSGWFIAAMALAGLGTQRIEYFLPAAAIRGLAVMRTGGRYLERADHA